MATETQFVAEIKDRFLTPLSHISSTFRLDRSVRMMWDFLTTNFQLLAAKKSLKSCLHRGSSRRRGGVTGSSCPWKYDFSRRSTQNVPERRRQGSRKQASLPILDSDMFQLTVRCWRTGKTTCRTLQYLENCPGPALFDDAHSPRATVVGNWDQEKHL